MGVGWREDTVCEAGAWTLKLKKGAVCVSRSGGGGGGGGGGSLS